MNNTFPQPVLTRNDRNASILIWVFSIIVFAVVTVLSRVKLNIDPGFDVHIFARINAIINSLVSILLIAGLVAIRRNRYTLHKQIMLTALILSVLFLLSYIAHHLLAGESRYGDINHDGILSPLEKEQAGAWRTIYLIVLGTHIPLAGIILPFILFTAYRALIAQWPGHKKLARITWPIWLYVSVTGVLVYWMISPYY